MKLRGVGPYPFNFLVAEPAGGVNGFQGLEIFSYWSLEISEQ